MTEAQPGSGSTDGKDGDWNRQASTFDWEGWIAEENEADAKRAEAKAANEAAEAAAAQQAFPAAQLNYPAPTGAPVAQPGPAPYPPPQGLTATFAPPPAPMSAYGYASPDGHPMPQGYAQPGVPFQHPVPTKRPLDVVSVLALIFGILPVIPAGFILGIVGIVRTANPIRRGRGLAVAGLVLSLLWAAATVALPLYLNGRDAQRDASGTVTRAATVSPAKLRKGDCYVHAALGTTDATVSAISVVPCSQPHNTVVVTAGTMPKGSWTNEQDMLAQGGQQCVAPAKAFFQGYPINPRLKIGVLVADRTTWNLGNRFLRCLVMDPDKQFTGDVRLDR